MNTASCPICGRALPGHNGADQPDAPFCSARCRLIDLGRWLGESYKVPEDPDSDSAPEEDQET